MCKVRIYDLYQDGLIEYPFLENNILISNLHYQNAYLV